MYLSNTLYRYITPRTALAMHCMSSVYQQLNHFCPCSTPVFYPQFSVFYTPISAFYPTVSAFYSPRLGIASIASPPAALALSCIVPSSRGTSAKRGWGS